MTPVATSGSERRPLRRPEPQDPPLRLTELAQPVATDHEQRPADDHGHVVRPQRRGTVRVIASGLRRRTPVARRPSRRQSRTSTPKTENENLCTERILAPNAFLALTSQVETQQCLSENTGCEQFSTSTDPGS